MKKSPVLALVYLIAIFIFIIFVNILQIYLRNSDKSQWDKKNSESYLKINEVQSQLNSHFLFLTFAGLGGEISSRDNYLDKILPDLFFSLHKDSIVWLNDESRVLLRSCARLFEDYKDFSKKIETEIRKGRRKRNQTRNFYIKELKPVFEKLTQEVRKLKDLVEKDRQILVEKQQKKQNWLKIGVFLLSGIGILILIFYISRVLKSFDLYYYQ